MTETAAAPAPAVVAAAPAHTSDGYIYVTNWQSFQHYKTGMHSKQIGLDWIKCYTELLDKDEYLELAAVDRALLHAIWMATGKLGNGRCPASVRSMKRRFRLRRVDLDPLIHAGFIEVRPEKASRPEQSREEEKNLQFELPPEPRVDARAPSEPIATSITVDPETEPNGEYDHAARRLLEACRAPADGSERWKLLQLRQLGASVGALESARERVLTKQGLITNPFGLAVTVIKAELRQVPA